MYVSESIFIIFSFLVLSPLMHSNATTVRVVNSDGGPYNGRRKHSATHCPNLTVNKRYSSHKHRLFMPENKNQSSRRNCIYGQSL